MKYQELELRNVSKRVRAGIAWEIFAAFGLGAFYIPVAIGLGYYPFVERPPVVGPLLGEPFTSLSH
jgi:hypothetical protein